jgi:hypothetical protein
MRLGLRRLGKYRSLFRATMNTGRGSLRTVKSLVNSSFRVVLGTRAVKCTDLSERLKDLRNNWLYYGKYGGALSVMALFCKPLRIRCPE